MACTLVTITQYAEESFDLKEEKNEMKFKNYLCVYDFEKFSMSKKYVSNNDWILMDPDLILKGTLRCQINETG